MAYANAVAHNIAAIRAARKEGASARAAKAAAKKETSLYAFLNTSTVKPEIKVTPPPAFTANLLGDEEKTVEAAQPIAEKSPELQMVERLCSLHGKGLFIKVKHPVRTDWMLLYSVIIDLRETYGWNEDSISGWLQFAREW